jgi:hypothetical protein
MSFCVVGIIVVMTGLIVVCFVVGFVVGRDVVMVTLLVVGGFGLALAGKRVVTMEGVETTEDNYNKNCKLNLEGKIYDYKVLKFCFSTIEFN